MNYRDLKSKLSGAALNNSTYSYLAKWVYGSEVNSNASLSPSNTPAGWTFVDSRDTATGYKAVALRNAATNEIVIVNAGTENVFRSPLTGRSAVEHLDITDWLFGNAPASAIAGEVERMLGFKFVSAGANQIDDALAFYDQIRTIAGNSTIRVDGHSLGAGNAEAQVAYGRAKGQSVTGVGFNSADFSKNILRELAERGLTLPVDFSQYMTHYTTTSDILYNTVGHDFLGGTVLYGGLYTVSPYGINGDVIYSPLGVPTHLLFDDLFNSPTSSSSFNVMNAGGYVTPRYNNGSILPPRQTSAAQESEQAVMALRAAVNELLPNGDGTVTLTPQGQVVTNKSSVVTAYASPWDFNVSAAMSFSRTGGVEQFKGNIVFPKTEGGDVVEEVVVTWVKGEGKIEVKGKGVVGTIKNIAGGAADAIMGIVRKAGAGAHESIYGPVGRNRFNRYLIAPDSFGEDRYVYGGGSSEPEVALQLTAAPVDRTSFWQEFAPQFAQQIGTTFGSLLFRGNPFLSSVSGQILTDVALNIANKLQSGVLFQGKDLSSSISSAFMGSLSIKSTQVYNAFGNAAVGTVSSFLATEMADALGLDGTPGEVFGVVASTTLNVAINNVAAGQQILSSLDFTRISWKDFTDPAAFTSMLGTALGSYFGSKLAAEVISPNTQGVAIWASVEAAAAAKAGFALGSALGGPVAGVVAATVAAFVAAVVTTWFGNLFFRRKVRTPTAIGETVLDGDLRHFKVGAVSQQNGGNLQLVKDMAKTAADTLNGVIDRIGGKIQNSLGALTQSYGHAGPQLYYKYGGVRYDAAAADEAVEGGVIHALRDIRLAGGNIFSKRVLSSASWSTLAGMSGNLNISEDYAFYLRNIDSINSVIKYEPTSEFSVGWLVTLQRASELGLDKFTTSDFHGGLRGFLSSFDLAGHGTAFENVRIAAQGGAMEIQARGQTGDGVFSILPQAIDGPSDNDILNARFRQGLAGWDMATYQVANPLRGVNMNADWSGSGNDVFWMSMPGTPAAGSVIDQRSDWMTAQAGEVYGASVQAAQHRGLAQMYVEFYDANRNLLSTVTMPGSGQESGGAHGVLANFNTISGTATAPVGAAYRRLVLRLVSTGVEAPYGFFTQPTSSVQHNDIANPRFLNGQAGWQLATNGASPVGWGDNLSPDWSGNGNDVLYTHIGGTPVAGVLLDIRSDWMATTAGVTYETSVKAAQHRGVVEAWVEFYDANKSYLGDVKMPGTARENGGAQGNLANFNTIAGFALAPSGAVYRRVKLRLVANGGSEPYAFFTQPNSRAVPSGVQELYNPRFLSGQAGWQMATNTTLPVGWGDNLNADYSGNGNDVLYSHISGTPTVGALLDIRSDWMATTAGVTYETSVQVAQHRGTAEVWVEYYDANRNYITAVKMTGTARESGGYQGDLANFNQIGAFAAAPAGTVWRRVNLRLMANGGGEPYAFFTRPISRPATGSGLSAWASLYPPFAGDWTTKGEAMRIEDMSLVGYTTIAQGASTTSGNDLVDWRLATAGLTIDDNHQEWVESGYYQDNGWGNDWVDTSSWQTREGGDDIFVGGAGNDTLYGRSGWDWLDGGAGADTLYGGEQNDTLIGGAGNDSLFGEGGDDYLAAGDGDDWSRGGSGADILADGAGGDVNEGGDGDDTFVASADYAFNWFVGGTFDFNSDPGGKDTVSAERMSVGVTFNLDYRPADWNGHSDATVGNPNSRAAVIHDAVTGHWFTSIGLVNVENGTGSNFNDRLYGTGGNNVLKGLAGNDQLYGGELDDVLEGGAGADLLIGGGYYDTASYAGSSAGIYVDLSTGEAFGGDADGDTLQEIENLRGSALADQLKGNFFHNRLEGLAGDDWLVATGGSDTFDGGEGKDFVDYSEGFAAGTSTYQAWVEDGYWEYDQYNGGQYWVVTGGHYETVTSTVAALTVDLASGTARARGVDGAVSDYTLTGVEGVVGTAHADSLSGGGADETFVGGAGNDSLAGGAGADTYVLNRGDGYDTVAEDATGWNVVSFGENVKFSDLWGGTAGGTNGFLDLGVRGDNAQVRVVSNFGAYPTAGNNKLKSIDLNGAGQLDIGAMTYGIGGDDNANTLNGSAVNHEMIFAYNGDDSITGSGGAWEDKGNVVIGGLGNDAITTSIGDDQFAYDRAGLDANGGVIANVDTINDAGGEDTIVFGPTVAAEDVIYEVVGQDLYIGAKDGANAALTASQVIDRIRVVNGGTLYREVDPNSYEVLGETLNTVEYVIAGGTSIDLRKLDINWYVETYSNYSNVMPIALDLDGDGLNLSTVEASNVVVKTAQGGLSKIGWVGPIDGFLAVDRDGDGAINRLSEISFVQDKVGATSDLEGLRTWDSNGDGVLDKADKDFSKILLFVDANQNGRSTKTELRTLEEAGIKAINLGGAATGYTRDMTIDSFVQNTISFVWADGRTGEGYDVALARRVLGSEGLYAGDYQAEWGARDEDGTLGQLVNDPKIAAKVARIQARKGLLDKLGASYDEVKAAAQLDFSDHDKVDAKIAQRWAKMDASQRAAWLSGQASGMDGQQNLAALKAISSGQALANALNDSAQAGQDLIAQGLAQAGAQVSVGAAGQSSGGDQTTVNGLGVDFGAVSGLGGGLAASQPLDGMVSASAAIGQDQAWWRGETDGGLAGAGSLAALLAAMDQGPGDPALGALSTTDDPALLQQQMLLRQAMAGFGGEVGGSAAVWNRDAVQASTVLAAASQTASPLASNLVMAS